MDKCSIKNCDYCSYDNIIKINTCYECREGFEMKNGVWEA